jgi:hypothetical protein
LAKGGGYAWYGEKGTAAVCGELEHANDCEKEGETGTNGMLTFVQSSGIGYRRWRRGKEEDRRQWRTFMWWPWWRS